MNHLWRVATGAYKCGVGNFGKNFTVKASNSMKSASAYSRTRWYMCSTNINGDNKLYKRTVSPELGQRECSRSLHTAGEKKLVDYLKTEIVEEQKSRKMEALPKILDGFSITANRAELVFKKENRNETISITMNVTHSVDTDEGVPEEGYSEMKAKPNFDIDIVRDNTTLSFSCSYVNFVDDENKSDVYQIDEVSVFEGEWNDDNYTVAADILDEDLYDLFMTLLHEKGITNDLMESISEVATFYEHSRYIELLQGIQKFASAN